MRRPLLWLIALVLVGASPAFADPPEGYPVDSFLYWTESSQRDFQDFAIGQYMFEAGQYGTLRRMLQRYPEHYGPDMEARVEAQAAIDGLLHNRPDAPYTHWGDAGHPWYMPDWDHDGVFGDGGGFDPAAPGDFDADTDAPLDTAYFRYPCYLGESDGWVAHHVGTSGACGDAGPFRLGIAREIKIVNSRGLVLDATLWIPDVAYDSVACPAPGAADYGNREAWAACATAGFGSAELAGVVLSNGLASRQEHYYYLAERLARDGYIVLTYDPAGQGESEGTWEDLFGASDVSPLDCPFPGACRDLRDVVRWFVGDPMPATPQSHGRLTPRRDPAGNPANPAAAVLDAARLSLGGHSMGALGTLAYLRDRCAGEDLPAIVAAVSLSGATDTCAEAAIQFQTSDFDGLPLPAPAVLGVSSGSDGEGLGYRTIKERYDDLRDGHDAGALALIVLEGSTHSDHAAVPYVPRTLWASALTTDYAADWLNCHAKGLASACANAVSARSHLSRAFASEQDPDGPVGGSVSLCITVPDRASLNQEPDDFVSASGGSPPYDCAP